MATGLFDGPEFEEIVEYARRIEAEATANITHLLAATKAGQKAKAMTEKSAHATLTIAICKAVLDARGVPKKDRLI